MPAVAPIPPDALKTIVVLYGYEVVSEDEYNWSLFRAGPVPIIIPKLGELVALDVLMSALEKSKMDNGAYFALLHIYVNQAAISGNQS